MVTLGSGLEKVNKRGDKKRRFFFSRMATTAARLGGGGGGSFTLVPRVTMQRSRVTRQGHSDDLTRYCWALTPRSYRP